MMQRTTLTLEADDLDVFRREAERRQLSLNQVLKEIVHEAAVEKRAAQPRPHFGTFNGPGNVVREMLHDDEAPARGRLRS